MSRENRCKEATTRPIPVLLALTLWSGCGDGTPRSATQAEQDTIAVCSFNIQFLGSFEKRDNEALSDILKGYDIVVIQELVAPPVDGVYPDGQSYSADEQSEAFFSAMKSLGFEYLLSGEDTGTGDEIHTSATSTEWWVTFYKPSRVSPAAGLPSGFLAHDRSDHEDYERVPYAFAFRNSTNKLDFVLISVHLMPGSSTSAKNRRRHELSSIATWIDANNQGEKDFIILGDMNIEDQVELVVNTPEGFLSLNDECRKTNTLMTPGGGKPYDHVMIDTVHTGNEIDREFDLAVVDLIEAMKPYWTSNDPYPGDPYHHNLFKQYYSDHHPVVFKMLTPPQDDD